MISIENVLSVMLVVHIVFMLMLVVLCGIVLWFVVSSRRESPFRTVTDYNGYLYGYEYQESPYPKRMDSLLV